jgi:hypothetical protein
VSSAACYCTSWDLKVPKDVDVIVKGIPPGNYTVNRYRVDKHEHNFFTKWLEDSAHMERVAYNGQGGSLYDLNIGMTLGYPGGWEYWWHWANNHVDEKTLDPERFELREVAGGSDQAFGFQMESNTVIMLEFIKI